MNLNQLYYFTVLADEEHFTRAAKKLDITQPSLSHAISMMEEELHTKLFEKKGRNVVITRYGREFLPYAKQCLLDLDEGVKKLQALNDPDKGQIRLGYIYTLADRAAPSLSRGFLLAHPEYEVEFSFGVGTTARLLDALRDDVYDVVLCSLQKEDTDIEFQKVGREDLVVVVPEGHPLAGKDTVLLKDTIPYPQIFYSRTSGLRPIIAELFKKKKLRPDIAYDIEEDAGVAGLVAEGFGIAVMPDIPLLKTMPVKRLTIQDPSYERSIYLAFMKEHYLPPVVRSFIEYIPDHFAQSE